MKFVNIAVKTLPLPMTMARGLLVSPSDQMTEGVKTPGVAVNVTVVPIA